MACGSSPARLPIYRWGFSPTPHRGPSAGAPRACLQHREAGQLLFDSPTGESLNRKVIVHIAASVDGYIAGPGDDLDWLTSRPAPKGFYGMEAFTKTIDTKVVGRRTYE